MTSRVHIARIDGRPAFLKFTIDGVMQQAPIEDACPQGREDPKYEVFLPKGYCWDLGRHLHAATLAEILMWARDIRKCPCEECIKP